MTKPIDPTGLVPATRIRIEDLAKADPVLAKKNAEIKDSLNAASANLARGQAELATQRKSYAQQKVQRIRESIKALKMTGIIDAKVLARMAAQLARELAAAVREYAAAGGNPKLNNALSDSAAISADIQIKGAVDKAPDSANAVEAVAQDGLRAYGKTDAAVGFENDDGNGNDNDAFADAVRGAVTELRDILRGYKAVMAAFNRNTDRDMDVAEGDLRRVERALVALDPGSSFKINA